MTNTERLAALELTQKELCKTCEILHIEVGDIKTNHLPHILAIATSAKFRAGILLYGLAFIAVMIAILTVVVALVR